MSSLNKCCCKMLLATVFSLAMSGCFSTSMKMSAIAQPIFLGGKISPKRSVKSPAVKIIGTITASDRFDQGGKRVGVEYDRTAGTVTETWLNYQLETRDTIKRAYRWLKDDPHKFLGGLRIKARAYQTIGVFSRTIGYEGAIYKINVTKKAK